jgi:hypothetical protein
MEITLSDMKMKQVPKHRKSLLSTWHSCLVSKDHKFETCSNGFYYDFQSKNFLGSTLKYASPGPRVIYVMIIRVVSNHEISPFKFCMYISLSWHAVAQLVEALCYKPESRDFDRIIGIFR